MMCLLKAQAAVMLFICVIVVIVLIELEQLLKHYLSL